jgi:hypothetical protein
MLIAEVGPAMIIQHVLAGGPPVDRVRRTTPAEIRGTLRLRRRQLENL